MSEKREVLFEIVAYGSIVKVTAVDPVTGIEAIIQGPAATNVEILKRNAMSKLNFLLTKESKK